MSSFVIVKNIEKEKEKEIVYGPFKTNPNNFGTIIYMCFFLISFNPLI